MAPSQVLVIDTGGDTIKCGFSDENAPSLLLPSLIGHDSDYFLIGNQLNKVDSSQVKYARPIDRGFVKNWTDLEKLYEYIYDKSMQIESEDYALILSEPPGNSNANREKLAQLMFEKFKVPNLCIKNQAVLSLHSYGRTTGLVTDCGNSITYIVPVFEGNSLNHSIEKYNVSGRDITNYLANLLNIQNKDAARIIKEKYCFIKDLNETNLITEKIIYKLPDGTKVNLNDERYQAAEVLFSPILIDMDIMGLHEIIYKTIAKTVIDLRRQLYSNICLCGGSSLLNGMDHRIRTEVKQLAPASIDINIVSNETRHNSSWVGGSVLASMTDFDMMCVSLSDYKENGASIISKKFS